MRPDKKKVVDEVWDDERVRSFLDKDTLGAESDTDFSALLFAYRSMRGADFARFIALFKDAGRNLDAVGRDGKTLLQLISSHEQSAEFRHILLDAGARP